MNNGSPMNTSANQRPESDMAESEVDNSRLQMFLDVDLDVAVEIGRARLSLEQVLALEEGSSIPLNKAAGDLLDVYVNGRLVARGEAVVVGDQLGLRIVEVMSRAERINTQR